MNNNAERRVNSPKAVDLFSGCGGLTLGLKQAGFDVIGAVEIDPLAAETYAKNHTDVALWTENIRELNVGRVMNALNLKPGELDLLAGCPPCQGYSTIRTRNKGKPVDDHRNDLIFEFLWFATALEPEVVMMENVPPLAGDTRFHQLLFALRKLGYETNHAVLNAADYGVPQRRRRLILIAAKNRKIEFAEPTGEEATVREFIGTQPEPGKSGDPLHDFPEKRSEKVLNIIKGIPKDGGSRGDSPTYEQLECHIKCDGFKDVYGRMKWDDFAPTITSGCVNPSKGRFLHPEQDRCITLKEAALLQTFPPDYYFSLRRGKFAAAEMVGNAWPPKFIKKLASGLLSF